LREQARDARPTRPHKNGVHLITILEKDVAKMRKAMRKHRFLPLRHSELINLIPSAGLDKGGFRWNFAGSINNFL